MFHIHRWRDVQRVSRFNAYQQCLCGQRRIVHRERNRPMAYHWLHGSPLVTEPTRGPLGSAGASRAL